MMQVLSICFGLLVGGALALLDMPQLAVIAALAGFGLALASQSSIWVVGTFLIATTVMLNVPGTTFTPVKAMTPIILVILVADILRTRRLELPPYVVAVTFLTLWISTAELLSSSMADFAYMIMRLLGVLVILVSLVQLIQTESQLRTIAIVLAFNLLLLGLTMPLFVSVSDLFSSVGARSAGLGGEPNWTGEIVARLTPFAVVVALDREQPVAARVIAGLALPSGVFVLFACASRGGTIAWLASLTVLVILLPRSGRARLYGASTLVAAILLIVGLAPLSYSSRVLASAGIGAHVSLMDGVDLTSGRLDLTQRALEAIQQSPFFGLGYGGFAMRYMQVTGRLIDVHNGLLGLAASAGIPAAMLGLWAFLTPLPEGLRSVLRCRTGLRAYGSAIVASLLASLLAALNVPDLMRPPVWIATALLAAFVRIAQKQAAAAAVPGQPLRAAASPARRIPALASLPPS